MTRSLRQSHDDLNIRAAFCIAFAAFLRPGELTWKKWGPNAHLTHLSRSSIEFTPNGLLLHLPKSKTDQQRAGVSIPIAPSPDEATCPVTTLHRLFAKYPKGPHEPLFSRQVGPFDYDYLTSRIQATLLHAGFNPQGYSGHSFRRGAANSAVHAGIDKKDVMDMGRWKSNAVDAYFSHHTTTTKLYRLSARLHHMSGPPAPSSSLLTNKSLQINTSGPDVGVLPFGECARRER